MSRILVENGTLILPKALLNNASILIEGKKILSVGSKISYPKDTMVIDANGAFVSPGFIDTHIHGSPGEIFKNEIPYGTTSIVIAESCAPPDEIYKKIRAVEKFAADNPAGKNILGMRLEGPYISKVKAGAQDKRYIKRPGIQETLGIIQGCGPLLKIVTVAPEIPGAIRFVRLLKQNKIIASIGHSNATYDEASDGILAGISHATHIFNAMRGPDRQDPGASTAVLLEDAVKAEVIPDLVHASKGLVDILIKIKGVDNTILVTDSVRAETRQGVRKRDGVYRFGNGTIAGSALTMIGALKNCVRECGISITDAAKMLTVNPAKLLSLDGKKGRIAAGMDADIVIFDKDFGVKTTIINGRVVYKR